MMAEKKVIRCAIYTRKSSEEGLEQDFNSLDAQREACESYIKSQQHEGWTLIEKQYNDGGFSGGTLERPALKELFQDIEDGKIDTVVVYKIDRLTRSLMDFSKIVELFDKKSTTFVSITQQFNTTTSMGRLTLNILLSFAQFEREVTGERIRDKKLASVKKGMWIGGSVPIGYKIEDKKLIPDSDQISALETIFEKYIEFESVCKLKSYLDENDIKSRTGKNFSKGNLYKILSNKIYIGMVKHKDTYYNGEHEGIIDGWTFNKVQEVLEKNRNNNKCKITAKSPSLLAGKLFDDNNNRMTLSHSNKKGKRYRYYLSQAIIQGNINQAGTITKIPAGEIETFVQKEIKDFLADKDRLQEFISGLDIHKQKLILSKASELELETTFIRGVLAKVVLYNDRVEIILCRASLIKALESLLSEGLILQEPKKNPEETIEIVREIRISTTSRKGSVLVVNNVEKKKVDVNPFLVNIISKGHYWNKQIREGQFETAKEIAESEEEHNVDYVKKAIRLNILSPRIVESILSGSQPADLTVEKLCSIKTLDWAEQEKILSL